MEERKRCVDQAREQEGLATAHGEEVVCPPCSLSAGTPSPSVVGANLIWRGGGGGGVQRGHRHDLTPRGRGQEGERGNDEEEEELSIYDPTTVITKEASRWRPLELTLSVTAPSASIARAGGRARQARRGEERRRIIHSFS
jgi:hypothetical protein